MKVLSLFSGICGMDIGFSGNVVVHRNSIKETNFIECNNEVEDFVELKKHNFITVFQNDILEGAKEVCTLNNINTEHYVIESIYTLLKNNYSFPKADVVIGGFPCQDFSHSGKRQGFNSDKSHNLVDSVDNSDSRGNLYKCFVEVVRLVKPKIFVAENVYGLLTMKGNPIEIIIKDFENEGYNVSYQLIDCSDYGIPQKRKRVIIMGILMKTNKIIENDWNIITKNKIHCNVGYYLKHLKEPEDTDDISQQMFSKAKKLEKGQGQKEIDLSSYAPTIRAEHHGNIEFRRHKNSILNKEESHLLERRLTVREAGLIQTFSPKFIFTNKKNMKAYKYIGNAVPPLLGYLIADKVKELLLEYF